VVHLCFISVPTHHPTPLSTSLLLELRFQKANFVLRYLRFCYSAENSLGVHSHDTDAYPPNPQPPTLNPNPKLKLKKAHAHNCWTATVSSADKEVTSTDRELVETSTGRNALMSPLPDEVPPHLAPELMPERPPMCSPLAETQPVAHQLSQLVVEDVGMVVPPTVEVPADRDAIQRTLDSHDLSPQADVDAPPILKRRGRNRPSKVRAAEMQYQFGAAMHEQASDVASSEEDEIDRGWVDNSPTVVDRRKLADAIVGGSTEDFDLALQAHAYPHVSDDGAPHRVKLRSALSDSPAESGYTSDGSGPGSAVSLLSVKLTSEADEGLTPSPLATKNSTTSTRHKVATHRNLMGHDASIRSVSIV
jgi:hypothetical protein